MELTIGIPAYNAKNDLRKLLASIEEELASSGLDFEVIIIDDGSTDSSAQVIPDEFPWSDFIHLKENVGIAQSTDYILEKMRGEYLLRLDADTRVTAAAVKKLLEIAKEDKKIGVLAPKLVDAEGNLQPSVETHFKHPLEWFLDYTLWLKKLLPKQHLTSEVRCSDTEAVPTAYMASAAVLISKKAIEEVGGVDPAMEFFMEDADWIWRINLAGWKVLYFPNAKIVHIGGQSGELYIHTRERSLKNLYYFYRKHCPGRWNQFLLGTAILSGSLLSLVLAISFYPLSLLKPRWQEIEKRTLKSFVNVLRWHLRRIL